MAEKINVGKFINNLDSEDLSSEKLQGVVGNVYAKAIRDHKTTAKKAEDNLKDKDKETVEFTKSNHDRLKAHKNKPEKDLNKDDTPVEDKVVKDINESVEDEIAKKQKQMRKISKRLDDMTAKNPDAEHTLKFRRLEADMESLAFEIEELKSKSVEESKKQRSPFRKVNESHDCKRNYKNVRFASQEIEKKGYSHAEANDIALKLFDDIEGDTQRSLEWHLEKILPKEDFDKEYSRNESLKEDTFAVRLKDDTTGITRYEFVKATDEEDARRQLDKKFSKKGWKVTDIGVADPKATNPYDALKKENLIEDADGGNLVVKGVTVTGVKDKNTTSVVVPEGIRYIGKAAFYKCTKLKEIKLPETLEGIESDAFAYCTSLEQLEIPKKVQYINTGAFAQCPSLKVLKLPAKFTKGDLNSRGIGFNTNPKIVAESKKTVGNKKLTEAKTFQPMTLREYGKKFLDGYLDTDVYDTEIDMGVAFVFDCDEEPTDNYEKFLSILADNVVVKDAFNDGDLTCDFSGFYKPYNDKINEWYKKNGGHQEFEGEEGYYDLVLATEGLVSGSYSEEDYKELCDIFKTKVESKKVNEASYRGLAYYEYKGCHVRETPSCFVVTNEYGTTIGQSQTRYGAEGIIDDYVNKKEDKKVESKELTEGKKIDLYVNGEYVCSSTKYKRVKDFVDAVKKDGKVTYAGLDNKGKLSNNVTKTIKDTDKVVGRIVTESKKLKEGAKPSELWYNKKEALNNIWGLVCEGDDRLEDIRYIFESGLLKPNEFRYDGWGDKHSLIMGALRNGNYKTAELLKFLGEKILKSEVEEYKDLMARKVYSDETTRDALDEAKSSKKLIYTIGDRFVAHQLDGVTSPFNREFDASKKYRDISNDPNFKHGSIGCKGKSYKAGVNQWVKDVEPTEFMVWTKKENPSWKDDVLDVYYRKETVNESKKLTEEVHDGDMFEFFGLQFSLTWLDHTGDEPDEFAIVCDSIPNDYDNEPTWIGKTVGKDATEKEIKEICWDWIYDQPEETFKDFEVVNELPDGTWFFADEETVDSLKKEFGKNMEWLPHENMWQLYRPKEKMKADVDELPWDPWGKELDYVERNYGPDESLIESKKLIETPEYQVDGKLVQELPGDITVRNEKGKLIGKVDTHDDAVDLIKDKDSTDNEEKLKLKKRIDFLTKEKIKLKREVRSTDNNYIQQNELDDIEHELKELKNKLQKLESLKEDLSKIQEEQTMKLVRLLGKGLITKQEFEQKLYGIIDEGSKLVRVPMFKNIKIKDFYTDNYPEDDLGEEINDAVTVDDVVDTLNNGGDLYKLIGVTDSLVRERLFEFIADICNTKYDNVYKKWLEEGLVETGRKFLIESQTQEIEGIMNRLKKDFGPEIEAKMDEFVNLPENSKKVWKSGYKIIPDEEIERDYEITYFQTPEHEPMYAMKKDGRDHARYGQVLDYSDIFYTEEGWNKFEKWLNDQGIFDTSTHFAISKFDNWPDGYWSTDIERFSTVDGAKRFADKKFKSADVVKIEDDRTHFGTANGETVRFKGKWMTEDDFFKLRNSGKA